jgi:hypothetical protein
VNPVREPDAGKPHVRFDEEGRETRDGPLGEWTPDPKGRKRWGAAGPGHDRARPSLYCSSSLHARIIFGSGLDRILVLAQALSELGSETVYMAPKARELIEAIQGHEGPHIE